MERHMKTPIIIGATGLVGNELLQQLIADKEVDKIKVFVRKPIPATHPKIEQHVIDFDNSNSYSNLVTGDVLYCCMGTTIKTAGSQEAFKKVDFQYPFDFGKIAKQNGVKTYVLVSSLGADKTSNNFYLRTKGEIEADLTNLKFESLVIVRPSMLLGNRKEFRLGELIGKVVMKTLSFLFFGFLKRYKAIEAEDVAKAMIKLSISSNVGVTIVLSDKLQHLAKS
jgi:uncharacterized protein YbjT (DUF2867 family)